MAEKSRIRRNDVNVLCPFYRENDRTGRTIRCEGFGRDNDSITRFRSVRAWDAHFNCYCEREYGQCPVYRCTYGAKYED